MENVPTKSTVNRQLRWFVGLTFAISWILWSPFYLPLPVPVAKLPYVHLLGSLGPMLAALVLAFQGQGLAGIRRLNGLPRSGWQSARWLAIGFLAPIGLLIFLIGIISPARQQVPDCQVLLAGQEFAFLSPVVYVLVDIIFFGLGEEVGWRGFVLPRLQTRYSAFRANLIITLFWAIWHWPLFLNPFGAYRHMDLGDGVGWLFSLVTGGMLFTWLFNTSRGNVLACALFHGMMDVVFIADLRIPQVTTYIGALITLWGLYVWFVYKPASLSPFTKVTLG